MAEFEDEAVDFADKVSKAIISRYNSLKKTGKPQEGREWTLLAGFLKTNEEDGDPDVICLATGTKCIGKGKRQNDGSIINDSHAEILARRLFIRYLFHQIEVAERNFESIFTKSNLQEQYCFTLKSGVKFHLYTSQTPCGDCSIYPYDECDYSSRSRVSFSKTSVDRVLSLDPIARSQRHSITNDESASSKRKETNRIEAEEVVLKRQKRNPTINIVEEDNINGCDNTALIVVSSQESNQEACFCDSVSCVSPLNTRHSSQNSNISELEQTAKSSYDKRTGSGVDEIIENQCLQSREFQDIQRTGAKCVPDGRQDPLLMGAGYHVTETLRTKPGRGERTLSMSCSDKIMKWCTLGLQGGLLSNLVEKPIYLESIVVGSSHFNKEAMLRGISLRGRQLNLESTGSYSHKTPVIHHCNRIEFEQSKRNVEGKWRPNDGLGRIGPSSAAILFCKEPAIHEVIVNGKKQGITEKHKSKHGAFSSVSKVSLCQDFKNLLSLLYCHEQDICGLKTQTCRSLKQSNKEYKLAREKFFQCFSDWITKPSEEEMFT